MVVQEAFIHCAKALRRSHLWEPDGWPDLSGMPTVACMLVEHAGIDGDPGGDRTAGRPRGRLRHPTLELKSNWRDLSTVSAVIAHQFDALLLDVGVGRRDLGARCAG